MRQWSWILKRIIRQIWFRAAIISLLSVALAIVAGLVTPYLPYTFDADIGQRSVGTILQIMASSMLAVTTFSLTAMVSAYSSATQLATPRATQLMVSDPTSQNALSTFLGAFVFSMVGIVGLNTSAYGHDGRIILFAATVVIILLVVGTLLRWIGHITAFGRMADVIDRVEEAATEAMNDAVRTALVKTFTIERHRSFDQDPRLGLIALSEIASRALAPATNDPGTGIEVLNALLRVFLTLRPGSASVDDEVETYPVHIGRPTMDDMLTDAFGPILREGVQEVEVSLRLTATLAALHANLPGSHATIESWAHRHAKRVAMTMADPDDLTTFDTAYRKLWRA